MRVVVFGQAILHHRVDWPGAVRDLAAGADAVICNFEGCLPPAGAWPMKRKTVHAAHAEAPRLLRDLGVTHLAIANNHAWDFGHAGIVATRARLAGAGFAVAGAGADAAEAWAPAIAGGTALIAVDAGPTPDWAVAGQGPGVAALPLRRIARVTDGDLRLLTEIAEATGDARRRRLRRAVGFDTGTGAPPPLGLDCEAAAERGERIAVDPAALDRLCAAVAAAALRADCVIVAIHAHHWSADWLTPPDWFDPVATACAAAGARAIVGSGAPWAFPARVDTGVAVAPGLGNLCFHTRRPDRYDAMSLPVWEGLAAVLSGGAWSFAPVPVARPPAKPEPDEMHGERSA